MALVKLEKGTLVGERYRIGRRLGKGGMGTVYKAQDTYGGRTVALKIVSIAGDERQSREDTQRRFAREIAAVNAVTHRNVLDVRDFGFEDDILFMVMEYLDGQDLGTILSERETPLEIDYAADIMLGLCAGITAVHSRGVIHRDIKPGNVMIAKSDFGSGWEVKIVDFGVSKSASMSADLTQEGRIVGTPLYIAPEQLSAEALPASDQYAISMLLYHCLTRHHPFEGLDGMKVLRAVEKGEIPPPRQFRPDLPERLEQVIMKGLKMNPADRHRSVFDLGSSLLEFASPLGRQFHQLYYKTPPIGRPKNSATMSTTGVSLVKQIAEGQLPFIATTVKGDYQAATAVMPVADKTLKDNVPPKASAEPTTTEGIPVPLPMPTPANWKWSDSRESERPPANVAPSTTSAPLWKRREPWIAGVACAAIVGLLVIIGVGHHSRSRAPADTTAAQPPTSTSAPAIGPGLQSPSSAPQAALPPSGLSKQAEMPRPEAPAASPVTPKPIVGEQASPTKVHHHHAHAARQAADAVDWKDPAGNSVPAP